METYEKDQKQAICSELSKTQLFPLSILNGISPPITEIFYITINKHNVRNFLEISNENRKTVKYGIETISNRTSFFWAYLSNECKLTGKFFV